MIELELLIFIQQDEPWRDQGWAESPKKWVESRIRISEKKSYSNTNTNPPREKVIRIRIRIISCLKWFELRILFESHFESQFWCQFRIIFQGRAKSDNHFAHQSLLCLNHIFYRLEDFFHSPNTKQEIFLRQLQVLTAKFVKNFWFVIRWFAEHYLMIRIANPGWFERIRIRIRIQGTKNDSNTNPNQNLLDSNRDSNQKWFESRPSLPSWYCFRPVMAWANAHFRNAPKINASSIFEHLW